MKKYFLLVLLVLVLVSRIASGQEEAPPAEVELGAAALQALGMAINTGGVYLLVFLLLKWRPVLKEKRPHWIPVLAIIAGPLLNALAAFGTELLGVGLDFSPLIGVIGGTGAVAIDQLYRQKKKAPAPAWPRLDKL